MPTGSLRLVISELEYRNQGRLARDEESVRLCNQAGHDIETDTSSFASRASRLSPFGALGAYRVPTLVLISSDLHDDGRGTYSHPL
jgi:hypothetical protein